MKIRNWLLLFGAILLAAWALAHLGCSGHPKIPDVRRESVRAAVQVTAESVRLLDAECARIVKITEDKTLGEACDAAYQRARGSLLAVATSVDTWERLQGKGEATCKIADAARAMSTIASLVQGKGGIVPPIVDDAASLVRVLGDCP